MAGALPEAGLSEGSMIGNFRFQMGRGRSLHSRSKMRLKQRVVRGRPDSDAPRNRDGGSGGEDELRFQRDHQGHQLIHRGLS